MKKIDKKLTIIKYGSNVLVKKNLFGDSFIDTKIIKNHGSIINKQKNPVLIVSSGAVAFGKIMASYGTIEDEIIRKRILASLGNPHLTMSWDTAIQGKKVLQGLITHRDLSLDYPIQSLKKIITSIYNDSLKSVIQINDNDFVSGEELKILRGGEFGDNDKITIMLAELCSKIFREVEIIFNTNSEGVVKNNETIPEIKGKKLNKKKINEICTPDKSEYGTGGMITKLHVISELFKRKYAMPVYIINGKKPKQLKKVLTGKKAGTMIC